MVMFHVEAKKLIVVKLEPTRNAHWFRMMCLDVDLETIRMLENVFATWTAHLDIVMDPHVNVKKIRVLEFLVARATFQDVTRGVLVLFHFVNLQSP